MIPRTLSASSLQVADQCLARYYAENILRARQDESGKTAANVGTACHYALEKYVEAVYMKKEFGPSLDLLLAYYHTGYLSTFDTVEFDTPEYEDGKELVTRWFKRTDLSGVEVVSVEQKRQFPLETSIGTIPLTYIWDRCDIFVDPLTGRKVCRVVDYKTIRAQLGHDDVRGKLQARIYDLMARIQFKDQGIDEFQVVFDLLRYEPVGIIFSRDEAATMWNALKARAERIIATPEDRAPETLNPDCGYCVRKLNCKALKANIAGGGKFGVSAEEAVALKYQLESQLKGMKLALEELDTIILKHAEQMEETDLVISNYNVKVSMAKRRKVDNEEAAEVLGPDLMKMYGKLGVSEVDAIIKSGVLPEDKVERLKRTFSISLSSPTLKITPITD